MINKIHKILHLLFCKCNNDKNFLAPQAHGFNRGLGAEVV